MFVVHIRYLVDESLMLDLTGSSLFPKSELHVPAQTQYTHKQFCQAASWALSVSLSPSLSVSVSPFRLRHPFQSEDSSPGVFQP